MRRFLKLARKDPPKTAGLTLLAMLAISALLLQLAYIKAAPAASPKTLSIYSPTTKPTTRESHDPAADSLIIQANSAKLEEHRLALQQSRQLRGMAIERNRLSTARRPAPPEPRGLERLFRLRAPSASAATPTTSPSTQPLP